MTVIAPPQVSEQARKAATYFERALRAQGCDRLGFRVGEVVLVVACDRSADILEEAVNHGFLPEKVSVHKPILGAARGPDRGDGGPDRVTDPQPGVRAQPLPSAAQATNDLVRRYHEPPADHAGKQGYVHLHVTRDMTLGRRKRLAGECLCSKKHGSSEVEPTGVEPLCPECVKVAEQNGLAA